MPLTTDQRGQPLDTPNPDIGAYQTQPLISLAFTVERPDHQFWDRDRDDLRHPGQWRPVSAGYRKCQHHALRLGTDSQFGTDGEFSAIFGTSTLGASTMPYTVNYSYDGDQAYAPQTMTSTVTVNKATPTVNVVDASGTYTGNVFGATPSVIGASGVTGPLLEGVAPTVTYFDGDTDTGVGSSSAPSQAGTYTVVANFVGSADYNASSSTPLALSINPAQPILTVTDLGGNFDGSAYAATPAVAGVNHVPETVLEGVAPTVKYYAGTTASGTALAGAPSTAGTYTVVSEFAGSTDYSSGFSSPVNFMIKRVTPTVHVTEANGTYTGSAFTGTPTVTGLSGSPGSSLEGISPTLAYYAGTTVAGTKLSGPPIGAGTYTVVATFPGSTDYFSASSAPVTFTISRVTPSVKISATNGSYTGTIYVATATVTGAGGTPASSLEGVTPTSVYYAGTTASGTPLLGAPINAGTFTAVASFGGSADYVAAQSAPVTFTITQAATKIALTPPAGSAVYGQPVTLVATVAGAGKVNGAPNGSVTFFDDGSPITTVSLNGSGEAVLTTSSLAEGSQSITASYNGGIDFQGVTSGSVSESIGQAGADRAGAHAALQGEDVEDRGVDGRSHAHRPGRWRARRDGGLRDARQERQRKKGQDHDRRAGPCRPGQWRRNGHAQCHCGAQQVDHDCLFGQCGFRGDDSHAAEADEAGAQESG